MSLAPEIQQQRYAAIELAYSERRWAAVEQLSRELLKELPSDPSDPVRLRVVLLLGHTRLYGLEDWVLARQYYGTVLEHSTEVTLQELAQQGLLQCEALQDSTQQAETEPQDLDQQAQPADQQFPPFKHSGSPTAELEVTAQSQMGAAQTASRAATPWLTKAEQNATSGIGSSTTAESATPWIKPTAQEDAAGSTTADAYGPATAASEPLSRPESLDAAVNRIGAESQLADVLQPEVVEEPDQIDVALADPSRARLIDVRSDPSPRPNPDKHSPLHFDPEAVNPRELEELTRGLLRHNLR